MIEHHQYIQTQQGASVAGGYVVPYTLYPFTQVVYELEGYREVDGHQEPQWGDRLAVYHTATGQILRLSPEAWMIYDTLASQSLSEVGMKPLDLDFSEEGFASLINALRGNAILVGISEAVIPAYSSSFDDEAEIYLELTQACNFCCKGCASGADRYLPGEARTFREEELDGLLTNTLRSVVESGRRRVEIKLAGGEPLLPAPFRLIGKVQKILENFRQAYTDVEIKQILLTNGVFLYEPIIEAIKNWNVQVSISLWGLNGLNDDLRGAKRLNEQYSSIVGNIKRLHDAGILFNINHVVSPDNALQFADFIRTMWDVESGEFFGRDWEWPDSPQPIPLGITFFRPQTEDEYADLIESGYQNMQDGLRIGFDVIRDLIKRGISIQPLNRIDYLTLFNPKRVNCGSGVNYIALGPNGATFCHEELYSMSPNLEQALDSNVNVLDMVNGEFAKEYGQVRRKIEAVFTFPDLDRDASYILLEHGSGCPRAVREESSDNKIRSSTASLLYGPLIPEILSLETSRRLKQ